MRPARASCHERFMTASWNCGDGVPGPYQATTLVIPQARGLLVAGANKRERLQLHGTEVIALFDHLVRELRIKQSLLAGVPRMAREADLPSVCVEQVSEVALGGFHRPEIVGKRPSRSVRLRRGQLHVPSHRREGRLVHCDELVCRAHRLSFVGGLQRLPNPGAGVSVTQVVRNAESELPVRAVRSLGDVASHDRNGLAETDDQGRGPGRPSGWMYHTESAQCIALSTL